MAKKAVTGEGAELMKDSGVAGLMGGGMYNTHLSGSGYVAILSDGPPVLVDLDGADVCADAQAAITWSEGVKTSVKADVNLKTLIGRASGETVQMVFSGRGWLLIQPSEGRVAGAAAGGQGGSGAGGTLGKILSG